MTLTLATTLGVAIFHLSLTTITFSLACFTRLVLVNSFGVDDWTALIAYLVYISSDALYYDGLINYGFGHHVADIKPPKVLEGTLKLLYICEVLYTFGTSLIKISFALTLRRFFQDRVFVLVLRCTIAALSMMTIGVIFLATFRCSPIDYTWQLAVDPYTIALSAGKDPVAMGLKPRGSCLPIEITEKVSLVQIAVMLAADLILAVILPVILVKDMVAMTRGMKISVGVLFAFGALASVVTVVRIPFNHTLTSPDFFYDGARFVLLGNMELAWCIIGVSLCKLKPLAVRIRLLRDSPRNQVIVRDDKRSSFRRRVKAHIGEAGLTPTPIDKSKEISHVEEQIVEDKSSG